MRTVIALLFLAVTISATSAQTPSPGYMRDSRTGCQIWSPAGRAVSWSGGCRNSFAHGRGVAQFYESGKPILTCDCEYRDGKANGHGIQTSANGRFDGEFRNDRYYAGVFASKDGTRTEGQWRDGQPFGVMKFTFTDGWRWEAPVRDGQMNGPLTLVNTKTGARWEGNVQNGEPIGSGKCFLPNARQPVVTRSVECLSR